MRLVLFVAVLVLAGCKLEGENKFGGTQSPSLAPPTPSVPGGITTESDEAVAQTILSSSSAIYKSEQSSSAWLSIAPSEWGASLGSNLDSGVISDSFSVIFVVKKNVSGSLFSFHPLDRGNQAFEVSSDASIVRARFFSSPQDYAFSQWAQDGSAVLTVAASLNKDDGAVTLAVNGTLGTTSQVSGTVTAPFSISRFVALGPIQGQSLDVKAVYLFNRKLSYEEQGYLLRSLSRKYQLSLKLDPVFSPTIKDEPTGPSGPDHFPQVKQILRTSCANCHGSWSSANVNFYVSSGLVIKGNALASPLYYRLRDSTGSGGPKNMPQTGSLTSNELGLIKEWIESL